MNTHKAMTKPAAWTDAVRAIASLLTAVAQIVKSIKGC